MALLNARWRLWMHSGQSSDCNDCSYELMSVDDLQMLGVRATGRSLNQGQDENEIVKIHDERRLWQGDQNNF